MDTLWAIRVITQLVIVLLRGNETFLRFAYIVGVIFMLGTFHEVIFPILGAIVTVTFLKIYIVLAVLCNMIGRKLSGNRRYTAYAVAFILQCLSNPQPINVPVEEINTIGRLIRENAPVEKFGVALKRGLRVKSVHWLRMVSITVCVTLLIRKIQLDIDGPLMNAVFVQGTRVNVL